MKSASKILHLLEKFLERAAEGGPGPASPLSFRIPVSLVSFLSGLLQIFLS
jgi:hypothetical protein